MRLVRSGAIALLAAIGMPYVASGHAFGEGVSLELPFSYLALGASIALIYSFGTFLMLSRHEQTSREIELGCIPRGVALITRSLGIAALIAVAYLGVFQSEQAHITVSVFWIGLMLIMAYVSALCAGVWQYVNPFESIASALFSSMRPIFSYPISWSVWPALIVYTCIILLELAPGGQAADPAVVSYILAGYLMLSLIGGALFGVRAWFRYGDFFSVFLSVFGMLAPIRIDAHGVVRASSPVGRLSRETPESWSLLFFILFMTASTSFDGLSDTQWWVNLVRAIPGTTALSNTATAMFLAGFSVLMVVSYIVVIYLMRWLTHSHESIRTIAMRFAYPLIPIAVAYNIAHYFVLVIQDFGPFRPEAIWTTQVAVVSAGHILATYLAHKVAARYYTTTRDMLAGQVPMLVLMVLFTILALRILSLPLAS